MSNSIFQILSLAPSPLEYIKEHIYSIQIHLDFCTFVLHLYIHIESLHTASKEKNIIFWKSCFSTRKSQECFSYIGKFQTKIKTDIKNSTKSCFYPNKTAGCFSTLSVPKPNLKYIILPHRILSPALYVVITRIIHNFPGSNM